jgi:hypothetical protein
MMSICSFYWNKIPMIETFDCFGNRIEPWNRPCLVF